MLAQIATVPPSCGRVRVIAIDGGAGAGKSTLAAQLAASLPSSFVLHLDDLIEDWTGQFQYRDRLRAQVLSPLAAGSPGRYQRYDWVRRAFTGWSEVPMVDTLLVEGVSALWGCAGALALGIFLDRPRSVRLQRWIDRDGPVEPEWLRWLDAEDTFFAAHPVPPGTLVG